MNTTHIGSLPKKRGGGVGGEEEAMSRRKEKEQRGQARVQLHMGIFV